MEVPQWAEVSTYDGLSTVWILVACLLLTAQAVFLEFAYGALDLSEPRVGRAQAAIAWSFFFGAGVLALAFVLRLHKSYWISLVAGIPLGLVLGLLLGNSIDFDPDEFFLQNRSAGFGYLGFLQLAATLPLLLTSIPFRPPSPGRRVAGRIGVALLSTFEAAATAVGAFMLMNMPRLADEAQAAHRRDVPGLELVVVLLIVWAALWTQWRRRND